MRDGLMALRSKFHLMGSLLKFVLDKGCFADVVKIKKYFSIRGAAADTQFSFRRNHVKRTAKANNFRVTFFFQNVFNSFFNSTCLRLRNSRHYKQEDEKTEPITMQNAGWPVAADVMSHFPHFHLGGTLSLPIHSVTPPELPDGWESSSVWRRLPGVFLRTTCVGCGAGHTAWRI